MYSEPWKPSLYSGGRPRQGMDRWGHGAEVMLHAWMVSPESITGTRNRFSSLCARPEPQCDAPTSAAFPARPTRSPGPNPGCRGWLTPERRARQASETPSSGSSSTTSTGSNIPSSRVAPDDPQVEQDGKQVHQCEIGVRCQGRHHPGERERAGIAAE